MAPATARTNPDLFEDAQADFRGGANEVTHPALLSPNQALQISNGFPKQGGGVESRGGFKYTMTGTGIGNAVFEFDQSTGTVLTFVSVGTRYYDETMQPWYEVFQQTPGTNDAVYFGSREKFFQIAINAADLGVSPPGAGNTFVFEYWNGAAWTDFTASVVEQVANSKQMRGAAGLWTFSWGDLAGWVPNQVDTRNYQYWFRIRCTLGGTNMGTNITHSQGRIQSDWVGRRNLCSGHLNALFHWPGMTLAKVAIDSFTFNVNRHMAASINDYVYIASDGQRPLRRWNGSLGNTRGGVPNGPQDAGLPAPSASTLTNQDNAAAYPVGWILGYVLAYEHGPDSILGESLASAPTYITIQNPPSVSGFGQVTVNFGTAKTNAIPKDVSAILIYATNNVAGVDAAQRGDLSRYNLIKRVVRGDATWNAGTYVDAWTPRPTAGRTPILYTNTPPFKPKGIVYGGDRLWIWNDRFVAWSDIARGDSWDPANIKAFPNVSGCIYHEGQLLVFHDRDISYIRDVNTGLPDIGFFWRGIGLSQPYTLTVGEGQIHFVSHDGPAVIAGSQVALTGRGKVWEGASYWAGVAPARPTAPGAFFEGRVWFGVDPAGGGPGILKMATLDISGEDAGAWSDHTYPGLEWGTLAVVHATPDHPLARQLVLCGIPHALATANYHKIAILEYGTTDNWTTNPYDGTIITTTVVSRAISGRNADRWKEFHEGHVKLRNFRSSGGSAASTSVSFQGRNGETTSKTLTIAGTDSDRDQDFCFLPVEQDAAGGGKYRAMCPTLTIAGASDQGWTLAGWLVRGAVDEFRPQ